MIFLNYDILIQVSNLTIIWSYPLSIKFVHRHFSQGCHPVTCVFFFRFYVFNIKNCFYLIEVDYASQHLSFNPSSLFTIIFQSVSATLPPKCWQCCGTDSLTPDYHISTQLVTMTIAQHILKWAWKLPNWSTWIEHVQTAQQLANWAPTFTKARNVDKRTRFGIIFYETVIKAPSKLMEFTALCSCRFLKPTSWEVITATNNIMIWNITKYPNVKAFKYSLSGKW